MDNFLAHLEKAIVLQFHAFGFGAESDTYFLHSLPRIFKAVAAQGYIVGGAAKFDGYAIAMAPIVAEYTALDDIAVGAAKLAEWFAKEQAEFTVVFEGSADEAVIRIAVADGRAVGQIFAEIAVFCQAICHAPAKKDTLAVAARLAVAENGAL